MVPVYLMYGTLQTIQETVDSLGMVRQMFQVGTFAGRVSGINLL